MYDGRGGIEPQILKEMDEIKKGHYRIRVSTCASI